MFAVVSAALLMSTLDNTIVATALHALQHGLGTSVTLAGWTITAYSLGMVVMLFVASKLTGRYGPRRVFLASVSVFTAASLCCGLTDNIYLLIVLRFLQASGGAGFTPSATRIVVENYGPARDKAVGLFGSIFTTGALIGPIIGGVIVAYWSWRGVFLVNVPIGLALVPLALRYVPADRPDRMRSPERLDAPGMILLGCGLLAGMIGLTLLGDTPAGWIAPCAVSLVIAAAALAVFIWHDEHTASPLVPPFLIHGRGFGAVNLVNLVYSGVGMGLVALIPLYATNRYGFGALGSGTLMAAEAVGAIVFSTTGAMLLRRTGYRFPLYSAAIVIAAGAVVLALHPMHMPAYAWVAIGAALVGIGIGWSNPASRNAGLQLVPDQASAIAALRSSGIQVGSIAAVSIATAVIAHAPNPGAAQAWVYAAYGLFILVAGLPAAARIPEHKGAW